MPYPHRNECMKKMRFVFLALFVALTVSLQAQEKAPLKLVETIPLPGLKDGDFDHFAPDVDGHRLFLTAEENGKVQVLDTNTNKLIHTIEDVKAPHAILYLQDLKKLFIVEGDASAVRVYDSDSYQAVGEIKVSIDADSIAYDPATNYLYVVNGGREAHTPYSLISVIDTNNSKRLRDITINSNHVEAIVLEKSGPRMFALPKISRNLHLYPQQAGTLAGIFFWGYLALQSPTGHLAKHWSPKTFIGVPAGFTYWGLITLVAAGLVMLLRATPANPETKTREGQ